MVARTAPRGILRLAAIAIIGATCLVGCARATVAVRVKPQDRQTSGLHPSETVLLKLENSSDESLLYYCGAEGMLDGGWREVLGSLDRDAPKNGVVLRKIDAHASLTLSLVPNDIDPELRKVVGQFRVICHVRAVDEQTTNESVITSNAIRLLPRVSSPVR